MESSSEDEVDTHRIHMNSEKNLDFPYREPRSVNEFPLFFEGVIKSNFYDVDSQTFKAYAKVIEEAKNLEGVEGMEKFLYCCVARGDIEIKGLFGKYAAPGSRIFFNLVPIMLWMMNSQKSKRFVEPLLVGNYEIMRGEWKRVLKKAPFGKNFLKFAHQPITLEEKDDLMLFYLMVYWKNIEDASSISKSVFINFVKEIVSGVKNPPSNIDENLIGSSLDFYTKTQDFSCIQAKVTDKMLKTILCTLSFPNFALSITDCLSYIYSYSSQEILPEITLLTDYLLSKTN